MKLYEMTVKGFCDQVAEDIPVPGGGSVAALNAELGASLFQMVGNMTIRKANKKQETPDYEVCNAVIKCKNAQEQFNELIEKDSAAFNRVMDAMKLPKSTDEEKSIRKAAIQDSYKNAILPPMQVAALCYELIDCGAIMYYKGDKNALSDACVGIRCMNTAFWSAIYNVRINLSAITDTEFVDKVIADIAPWEKDIDTRCTSIIGDVKF